MTTILILTLGIYMTIDIVLRNLSVESIDTLYSGPISNYTTIYNVKRNFIISIIKVESGGNPFAIGGTNDFGLMQITQPALTDFNKTHNTNWTLYDIWISPDKNIHVGVWYLSWLLSQFSNDYVLAVSAYNQGIGNVQKGTYSSIYWNNVLAVHKTLND